MPDRPEIYNMAGHLIRRLHQISVAVFADHMAREGVELTPVQFAALSAIRAQPGIDQATLAGAIAYDKATLGGVIDRLEGKGLIARAPAGSDGRQTEVALTDAGQGALAQVRVASDALQAHFAAKLSPDDLTHLTRTLARLAEGEPDPTDF